MRIDTGKEEGDRKRCKCDTGREDDWGSEKRVEESELTRKGDNKNWTTESSTRLREWG